jgi:hypothetical protein
MALYEIHTNQQQSGGHISLYRLKILLRLHSNQTEGEEKRIPLYEITLYMFRPM